MFVVLFPLMPEVVSSTSLPSSMIVHDLGTWILQDKNLNPLKSSENSEMKRRNYLGEVYKSLR